jgi:hypothetical protein
MSYCGALPASSESRILIDACLARVRADAGLDNDPVLPPLELIVDKPTTRFVVSASAHNLPTAEAIVTSMARGDASPKALGSTEAADPPKLGNVSVETTPVTARAAARVRSIERRMRWPVFLCGFVAGMFGGVALMKSPVGQTPAVQRTIHKARTHVAHAYATAIVTKRTLVSR